MAVNRIYCATGLTGGTTGDLDTIDGADLADKDMAIVCDQTTFYFYVLDSDSGAAESSPDVISPDDNASTKRWILQSLRVNDITISDDVILVSDDITIGGLLQVGTADGTGANLTIYSNTAGDTVVYDPAAKTFTFTDIQLIVDGVDIPADVALNTTHRSSDGSDHTFIDQDVTSGSSPTFDLANMSGNPDINGGTIDGATLGGAVQVIITDADINGGSLDNVPIGAATPASIVGTTIDATTDFTVGGTVITDNTITDDGTLVITSATGINLTTTAAAGSATEVNVGTTDSKAGRVNLYADDDTQGGYLYFQVPPDNDGNGTTYWLIDAKNSTDDLYISANNADGMMRFLGGATPSISITVACDVDAALTATTVDADTDFTVGGTVITDNTITDDGTLDIVATQVDFTTGLVGIGADNTTRGGLYIFSSNTGGGWMRLYVDADDDATIDYYSIQSSSDDLLIGPSTDTSALKYDGTANQWVFGKGSTFAGTTIADLGTVSTANIDGGTIDGVTTLDLTLGAAGKITLTPATADDTATGTILASQTIDTNAVGIGGLVYLNSADGNWDTAECAAAATTSPLLGIALGTTGAGISVLTHGIAKDTAWAWTPGAVLYVDNAGTMSHTAPSGGEFVRIAGHAVTSTTVFFNPSPDFIETQ